MKITPLLVILLALGPACASFASCACPNPNVVCAACQPPTTYGGEDVGAIDANGFRNPCNVVDYSGGQPVSTGLGVNPQDDDPGNNGQPGYCAYFLSAQGFYQTTAPVLGAVLALLLLMLAIWQGPRLVRALTRRFSRA